MGLSRVGPKCSGSKCPGSGPHAPGRQTAVRASGQGWAQGSLWSRRRQQAGSLPIGKNTGAIREQRSAGPVGWPWPLIIPC